MSLTVQALLRIILGAYPVEMQYSQLEFALSLSTSQRKKLTSRLRSGTRVDFRYD